MDSSYRNGIIHQPSIVDKSAKLGAGTIVWHFAIIREGVQIGTNCAIGSSVYIGSNTRIGNDVRIQDKAHLTDRMVVGNRVFIGPGVLTMNDRYPKVNNPDYVVESPTIEDDVSIGSGAIILPGIRIGRGAIIGAGAIVTKNVPEQTTVRGKAAEVFYEFARIENF